MYCSEFDWLALLSHASKYIKNMSDLFVQWVAKYIWKEIGSINTNYNTTNNTECIIIGTIGGKAAICDHVKGKHVHFIHCCALSLQIFGLVLTLCGHGFMHCLEGKQMFEMDACDWHTFYFAFFFISFLGGKFSVHNVYASYMYSVQCTYMWVYVVLGAGLCHGIRVVYGIWIIGVVVALARTIVIVCEPMYLLLLILFCTMYVALNKPLFAFIVLCVNGHGRNIVGLVGILFK